MANVFTDYRLENILKQSGLIANWLLDDLSGASSARVLTPGQAMGRNICVNGTFDSDTVWTKGAGWTISGGVGVATSVAAGASISQSILLAGKVYQVTFDLIVTSGSARIGGGATGTVRSASGTYVETLLFTSATFNIQGVSTFTGTLDNVVVTELNIPPIGCFYSNPTLIADGDMEAAGTASWTAGNSATLSKQSGTPHGVPLCLRIARNGVSTPYAGQTVLTIGTVYRVYGYCRSDGSATPIVRQGSTTIFTGTVSTSWQSFDIVFVATATDIEFGSTTNTGTQYVEFDDCAVTLDTSLRLGELIQDGDMEASGTGVWVAANSATLTKDAGAPHVGTQNLRVARNGVNNPAAQQIVLATGKRYRVTGYCKSDGSATPILLDSATQFTGTTSTSWQFFDVVFIAAQTTLNFRSSTSTGTQYTEWDDISITEISPMVGLPVNGVVQQAPALGHLLYAYSFDGTNDVVNIYSAQLNSIFNPSEGALILWGRVSGGGVWTDGTNRFLFQIRIDASNQIEIQRITTNNTIRAVYLAGGTNKLGDVPTLTREWFQVGLTWSKSNDQVKVYFNGVPSGSALTGLGTWAGNFPSNQVAIGASDSSGSNPWSGKINDVRLYNRALSAPEMLAQYRKYLPQFQFVNR